MDRDESTTGVLATLLAVSGGIHLRLYLGGYRDIHIDRVVGIDLSRSFVASFVTAALLAAACVVTVDRTSLRRPVFVGAALYGLGAIGAYVATRTIGLLGFEDTAWSWEAVVAKIAEIAIVIVASGALTTGRARSEAPAIA